MKTVRIILSISFLLLFPILSKAQLKYEREYRMKVEMIPKSAKEFVNSISPYSKIKWYKELSLNEVSIEAKFKHNNKKFSVEFDTLGVLQDVEFVLKKTEIAPLLYTKMEHSLDSLYQKWKFQKIQMQYIGKQTDITALINENQPSDTIKVSYEIVLKGKALGNMQLYEITFDNQGLVQQIQQIVQDKVDHLEY
jgi:sporulation protein YlmC with PRC-barrel domain